MNSSSEKPSKIVEGAPSTNQSWEMKVRKRERRHHHQKDDRVKCESCQKAMVPRLHYNQGFLTSSLCPFCGSVYKDFQSPPGVFNVLLDYLFWGIGILGVVWILFAMVN